MSKIQYIAFGGQDERSKSCSAIEIDGDIFILNCGITLPPAVVLGVQKIIPDFSWILKNKDRVRGIFVATPSYDNFGGVEFLLKNIPNIPIYSNNVGAFIIRNYFNHRHDNSQNQIHRINLNIINSLEKKTIGKVEIFSFRVVNSIPHSAGFIFKTKDGSIIFIDDFILPVNKSSSFYDIVFEINKITNNQNLLLITSVGNASNNLGFTSPNYRATDYFDTILTDAPSRTIIAISDHDGYKVISAAGVAAKKSLPFNIYSNTFSKTFNFFINNKLLNINNLLAIDDSAINEMKKGVIIVSGTTQRLFAKLEKIIDGEDNKIQLRPDDTFILASPSVPGFEKQDATIIDQVYKAGLSKVYRLPKNILPLSAGAEDHKFLVNLLRPKYIIMQKGLYMDCVKLKNNFKLANVKQENILITENGKILTFNNGNFTPDKQFVKINEQYIGTQGVLDVAASSLFERDQMGENGVVLASIIIDKNSRTISNANYDNVGIANLNDSNKEIINEINGKINEAFLAIIKNSSNGSLNKENQATLKKFVVKLYDKYFSKRPLVLLTIIYKNSNSQIISENSED